MFGAKRSGTHFLVAPNVSFGETKPRSHGRVLQKPWRAQQLHEFLIEIRVTDWSILVNVETYWDQTKHLKTLSTAQVLFKACEEVVFQLQSMWWPWKNPTGDIGDFRDFGSGGLLKFSQVLDCQDTFSIGEDLQDQWSTSSDLDRLVETCRSSLNIPKCFAFPWVAPCARSRCAKSSRASLRRRRHELWDLGPQSELCKSKASGQEMSRVHSKSVESLR